MRKLIAGIAIAAALAAAFAIGNETGKRHVIQDSELWIVDFEETETGADLTVHIHIDGNSYAHDCYIG